MHYRNILLAVMWIIIFSGCVSSKEYKAKLSDIDSLKQDISALEEKLRTTESEFSDLKTSYEEVSLSRDMLSGENAKLKEEVFDKDLSLKRLNDELDAKNLQIQDLTTEIGALSSEKLKAIQDKEKTVAEMKETYSDLITELNEEIKQGGIEITQLRDKLSLRMVEEILFDSGSAEIKQKGKKVLERVGDILKNVHDKEIRVEGHTDNVPIGSRIREKFPTNWDLSTARANNVVRYLLDNTEIDPKLLSAAGYSKYRPVASNDTIKGRAKNRRIEIVLIPVGLDRMPLQNENVKTKE